MKLVLVRSADVDAITDGSGLDLPTARGWPHENTLAGLSFLRSGGTQFFVVDDDGRIAGDCGTKTPPNAEGGVEIGYGLAAPSRGQGLGTRAITELIAWLAEQPQVTYVEAEIHTSNIASRRLAERLGFTQHSGPIQGFHRYRLPLAPKPR